MMQTGHGYIEALLYRPNIELMNFRSPPRSRLTLTLTPSTVMRLRIAGQSIYFACDTALFSDMKLLGESGVDVAVLHGNDGLLVTAGEDDLTEVITGLHRVTGGRDLDGRDQVA